MLDEPNIFLNKYFFSNLKVLLWNKSIAIKIYVKIPSLRQVFWVEVRRLQEQGTSIWALVFYYCIYNNLPREKVVIQNNKINLVFQIYFLTKYTFFYIKSKSKEIIIVGVWLFLFFNVFRLFFSMSSNFCNFLAILFFTLCITWKKF